MRMQVFLGFTLHPTIAWQQGQCKYYTDTYMLDHSLSLAKEYTLQGGYLATFPTRRRGLSDLCHYSCACVDPIGTTYQRAVSITCSRVYMQIFYHFEPMEDVHNVA